MAIILNSGKYIKIKEVLKDKISYYEFNNEDHRKAKKSPFFGVAVKLVNATVDLSVKGDSEKSIAENIITAGYTALKNAKVEVVTKEAISPFATATDI